VANLVDRGWSTLDEIRDDYAVIRRKIVVGREAGSDGLAEDAEPRTGHATVFLQILQHGFRFVRRNRETEARVLAGAREDHRVDADDLSLQIEEWASGIPGIDRGVRLEKIIEGAHTDRAVLRRDDTDRDRVLETERISDGENRFGDTDLV